MSLEKGRSSTFSGKFTHNSNNVAKMLVQPRLNFSNNNPLRKPCEHFDNQDHQPRKRAKVSKASATVQESEPLDDIWEIFNDLNEADSYDFFGDDFDKESTISTSASQSQETVSSFSIYRLRVNTLERQFNRKTEVELIDEIIRHVNAKYGNNRNHFEKRLPSSQKFLSLPPSPALAAKDSSKSMSQSQSPDYGFHTVVYIQKVYYKDKFLSFLDIEENHVRVNKIIFYHRPREIFAITVGSTWQVVQPYSCYDFPYEISGRLTSTEGSLQETLKPLTGNVRSSKTTKKNASLFDHLNNVRFNVVKEVRPDSSIYWLKEFSWEDKTSTKIRFGLANVRIERCIKPGNIPEILNHFSMICNKETTLTFPDAEHEKHTDDLPMIRPVPLYEYKYASEHLCKLVYGFMHHNKNCGRIHDFDLSHKHVEDFNLASDFKLKYDNGHGVSYTVEEFSRCPTAKQLFSTLREKCRELSIHDYSNFKARIMSNVKITFAINGRKHEGKVWDLLEGDVSLEQHGDVCRILGQWCTVRDEYHFEVHKKFLDLLRRDSILLYPGENGHLPLEWNGSTMKSMRGYVKSYQGMVGYFLPENPKELALFDLMYVSHEQQQNANGLSSIYLYYVFDRFDAGIRDASTRVLKSLETLFTKDPPSKNTKKESLLQQFYNGQCSKEFKDEFPSFNEFQKQLMYGNVFIVVSFLTEHWTNKSETAHRKEACVQTITNYFKGTKQKPVSNYFGKDNRIRSFYHERTLQLSFNVGNIQSFILKRVSADCKREICTQLDVTTGSDIDQKRLASVLLDRLLEKGYCSGKEDCAEDKPISGKLLKIKNAADFKLFPDNADVNMQVFKLVQRHFITQFPGFIHKLECFRIHENIMQWPRINLRFTEIAFQSETVTK